MTDEQKIMLSVFEDRVRKVLYRCDSLQMENADLKTKLSAKQDELKTANLKIQELNSQYDNLKIARVVTINQGEVKNAKQRLSKLVREVDRCIALLNE